MAKTTATQTRTTVINGLLRLIIQTRKAAIAVAIEVIE